MHTHPVKPAVIEAPPAAHDVARPRSDAFAGLVRDKVDAERPVRDAEPRHRPRRSDDDAPRAADAKPQAPREDRPNDGCCAPVEAKTAPSDSTTANTAGKAAPTDAATDPTPVAAPTADTNTAPGFPNAATDGDDAAAAAPAQGPTATPDSGAGDTAATTTGQMIAPDPTGNVDEAGNRNSATPQSTVAATTEIAETATTPPVAIATAGAATADAAEGDAAMPARTVPATPAAPAEAARGAAPASDGANQATSPGDSDGDGFAGRQDGETAGNGGRNPQRDEHAAARNGQTQPAATDQAAKPAGMKTATVPPTAADAAANATGRAPDLPPVPAGATDQPAQTQPAQTGHTSAQTGFGAELRTALAATTASGAETATPRTPAEPAMEQLAVRISRAARDGVERLTVQLRPMDLGRVSVKLEVGQDHRVMAVISAERADTMELLQRDSRALERALQEAGLKTGSDSLQFETRGDGRQGNPFSGENGRGRPFAMPVPGLEAGPGDVPVQAWQIASDRIDIRI